MTHNHLIFRLTTAAGVALGIGLICVGFMLPRPVVAREDAGAVLPDAGPAACMTLEDLVMAIERDPVPSIYLVYLEAESGDTRVTVYGAAVPTSLNFRLHEDCVVETWEEPLAAPKPKGVPA